DRPALAAPMKPWIGQIVTHCNRQPGCSAPSRRDSRRLACSSLRLTVTSAAPANARRTRTAVTIPRWPPGTDDICLSYDQTAPYDARREPKRHTRRDEPSVTSYGSATHFWGTISAGHGGRRALALRVQRRQLCPLPVGNGRRESVGLRRSEPEYRS